jgi:hypothetical protein
MTVDALEDTLLTQKGRQAAFCPEYYERAKTGDPFRGHVLSHKDFEEVKRRGVKMQKRLGSVREVHRLVASLINQAPYPQSRWPEVWWDEFLKRLNECRFDVNSEEEVGEEEEEEEAEDLVDYSIK